MAGPWRRTSPSWSEAGRATAVEFDQVLRTRRMVRRFTAEPVGRELLLELLDLALRAPSAGNTGATEFVVLEGSDTARFWDHTLPAADRGSFAWPGLLQAAALVLPLASREAYLRRYEEPDKAASLMTGDASSWAVPYWDVDCAFATMNLLLAAHSRGLGALFFAVVRGRQDVLTELGIPAEFQPIGAVALGWPAPERASSSAGRGRPDPVEAIHWGRYGQRG